MADSETRLLTTEHRPWKTRAPPAFLLPHLSKLCRSSTERLLLPKCNLLLPLQACMCRPSPGIPLSSPHCGVSVALAGSGHRNAGPRGLALRVRSVSTRLAGALLLHAGRVGEPGWGGMAAFSGLGRGACQQRKDLSRACFLNSESG